MRFKDYLNERRANVTMAFWISPKGHVLGSMSSHIQQVIMNADKFGLDIKKIRSKFEEYDERVGLEGKAREDIIKRLLWEGWIRIRKYPNYGYSINVAYYPAMEWGYIIEWAQKMLNKNVAGFKETDESLPVYITDLNNKKIEMTIGKLANYAELDKKYLKEYDLLESNEVITVREDFWTMNIDEEVKELEKIDVDSPNPEQQVKDMFFTSKGT